MSRIEALRRLHQIGAELAAVRDDEETLLLQAVRAAQELIGATYTSLGFVEGECIHWRVGAGKPLDEVRGFRQPLEDGLCGWVVRHGRSRRVDDVTKEPDYFRQYAEMRSELDVPIKVGERVIGVLNGESPEIGAFTEEDEALLQILAAYVAVAVAPGPQTGLE